MGTIKNNKTTAAAKVKIIRWTGRMFKVCRFSGRRIVLDDNWYKTDDLDIYNLPLTLMWKAKEMLKERFIYNAIFKAENGDEIVFIY